MIRKLRVRFVLINMLIVSLLLTVMMVLVFRFNSFALEDQSVSLLRRLAVMNEEGPGPGNIPAPEPPVAYFVLRLSPEGELAVRGSDYYDLSDTAYLTALLEETRASGKETGILPARSLRYFRTAGPWGENVVFCDISGEEQVLRNLRSSCLVVGGISFVAFFLVSIGLAFWAVRPVEKAWQQQRRFVADASHELKTPLSVIMANAELLQGGDSDAEARERFSGHILDSAYQMRGLVEQMLELARVDAVKPPRVRLDMSQLVQDAVLSVDLLFREAERPLVSHIREDVFLRGNENQLFQLMDVLLDNALKYAQGDGPVEVVLRTQGGYCLLSVSSPGRELTRRQCRDIFKRFYRVDQARTGDGSYGLGLSIARGIVQGHRGTIRAASGGGRNLFTVRLPLAPAPRPAE